MQDQSAQNPLFSFVVLPTPLQYITFLPISPTSPDFISPTSQTTFASFCFNSAPVYDLYCPQEQPLLPPATANTQPEHRHTDIPSLTSINAELSNPERPLPTTHLANTLYCNPESNGVVESGSAVIGTGSSGNKNERIKQSDSRGKELQEDKQYVPDGERRKKRNQKYHENENRNIVPNEINQIFSFIQKYNKSSYLLQKLFDRFPHPPSFTMRRFYLYQGILKGKLGHYTNERSLKLVTELYEPKCESWPEQEQRFYNKLCRILIRHFLYEDSVYIILTSKRMKREKKLDHLRARRAITRSVLDILRGF